MVSPLDVVSLLVALSSAYQAQENVSPIVNMKLDPRKKMLTWNYSRNVTWHECTIDTPPNSPTRGTPKVTQEDTYFCVFPNSVLHRGAILTVNATADGDTFEDSLVFRNAGPEGSAAIHFSCLIYQLRFMNCSWAPGPAAPADVQYRLYAWTSPQDDDLTECPHYLTGPTGTHVGCHFDQLAEPKHTDNYFFLVNGTSRDTAIQFLDFTPFKAILMEKYKPPSNIMIRSNGSHHIIQWDNVETRFNVSSHILCYELDIQGKGSSFKSDPVLQRGADPNVFLLPASAARAQTTLRVRVKHVYGALWSDWSPALPFGLAEQDTPGTPVALVGMVVGASALLITVLMFLCTRFSLGRRLFPPVPQVNRDVMGTFAPCPEVAWEEDRAPPGSLEPEHILAVEETPPSAGGPGGPASRPRTYRNDPSEQHAPAV